MEKPHKKLNAWKESLDLVVTIHKISGAFPRDEQYGLTNQMRRAILSVPCNIAEGAARQTKKEFINYLHMAQGSLSELDTQLEVARHLGYINEDSWRTVDRQIERIDKQVTGLIRHLKNGSVKK